MGMRVKSELKKILDQRDISIRKLSEMTNNDIKFETLRRLYNDETVQYQRDTIGKVCEVLGIELSELLVLVESDNDKKDSAK